MYTYYKSRSRMITSNMNTTTLTSFSSSKRDVASCASLWEIMDFMK